MMTLPHDYARCAGTAHPTCQRCRRREPGRDQWQSYMAPAIDALTGECGEFIEPPSACASNNTPPAATADRGSACNALLFQALDDAAYDCLSALAGVDTHDVNLRDHQEAWEAVEAFAAKVRAAERERWESAIAAEMPADFKCWHQTASSERPQVAAWVIRNLREREALAWSVGPNVRANRPSGGEQE